MIPITNPEDIPDCGQGLGDLALRIEALEGRLAILSNAAIDPTGFGGSGPARDWWPGANVAGSDSDAMSLARRIERQAQRLDILERRAEELAAAVERHEELLRILCLAMKQLDDPYGMGTSLDERIGLDELPCDWDDDGRSP